MIAGYAPRIFENNWIIVSTIGEDEFRGLNELKIER
jgi:hypothetical protein